MSVFMPSSADEGGVAKSLPGALSLFAQREHPLVLRVHRGKALENLEIH